MHVIVTGSRDLVNATEVHNQLYDLYNLYQGPKFVVVVGDCPTGADLFAKEWFDQMNRYFQGGPALVDFKEFKADWGRACDEKCYHPKRYRLEVVNDQHIHVPYCPVAGHLRNQEMVDYVVAQQDEMLYRAYFKQGAKNRGTADCRRRCRTAGIDGLKIVEPR